MSAPTGGVIRARARSQCPVPALNVEMCMAQYLSLSAHIDVVVSPCCPKLKAAQSTPVSSVMRTCSPLPMLCLKPAESVFTWQRVARTPLQIPDWVGQITDLTWRAVEQGLHPKGSCRRLLVTRHHLQDWRPLFESPPFRWKSKPGWQALLHTPWPR